MTDKEAPTKAQYYNALMNCKACGSKESVLRHNADWNCQNSGCGHGFIFCPDDSHFKDESEAQFLKRQKASTY